MSTADEISVECERVCAMLLRKNAAYGDSALDPVRVFSKASPVEQILVRIDDKLSRLFRGGAADGEDTEMDLLGYLVLLRIARRREALLRRAEKPLPAEHRSRIVDDPTIARGSAEEWDAMQPVLTGVTPVRQ